MPAEIVLRKKDRGIWKATTWAASRRARARGRHGPEGDRLPPRRRRLRARRDPPGLGDIDLGILGAGGVSGGIHPEEEAEPLGQALRDAGCRVLFVENDEQLDKALLVRDRCPALQRIVIIDMKGLRDFADPMCESLEASSLGRTVQRWRLGRRNRGNHRRPAGGAAVPAAPARAAC